MFIASVKQFHDLDKSYRQKDLLIESWYHIENGLDIWLISATKIIKLIYITILVRLPRNLKIAETETN